MRTTSRPFPSTLVTSLLAAAALLSVPAVARVSVGTAYSLDDQRVLYRERRVETWRDGQLVACEVDYLTPEGELFAEKSLSFDSGLTTPRFSFVDYREEFREGASPGGGAVELYSGSGEGLERRSRELPELPVIDAGFDTFVRREFDRLRAGERLSFDFAVPAQQRFVRFEIEKVDEVEHRGRPALELRMRPDNPLLRLLVDPIRLLYGPDRRLLEFTGISDIRDDGGDRHEARIVFEYPAEGDPLAAGLGAG